MAPLVELRGIVRAFGGVRALKGVDFTVEAGEVHALVGENGAGKSTLMRVLAGEIAPDAGEIRIAGEHVTGFNPGIATSRGIAVIHQETALAPDLSVAENIFMRELPIAISWPALRRRARDLLTRLGFAIDPRSTVGDLAVAQSAGGRNRESPLAPGAGHRFRRAHSCVVDPGCGAAPWHHRRTSRRRGRDRLHLPSPRRGVQDRRPDHGDEGWAGRRRGDGPPNRTSTTLSA